MYKWILLLYFIKILAVQDIRCNMEHKQYELYHQLQPKMQVNAGHSQINQQLLKQFVNFDQRLSKQLKSKLKHQYTDQHIISIEELCMRLNTNIQIGLTSETAQRRLNDDGPNIMPIKWIKPKWVKYLLELMNWFAIMLWCAAIICFIIHNIDHNSYFLGIGCALIAINLVTGFFTLKLQQKQKNNSILAPINKVLRDGKLILVPRDTLVQGDVVEVMAGQVIPADLRIIQSYQVKIDNSVIIDQDCYLTQENWTHKNILQTKNICFSQTLCIQGRGRGIVLQIGKRTLFGRNKDLLAPQTKNISQLNKEISRLILMVSILTLSIFIILMSIAISSQFSIFQCLVLSSGLIIASIPEGLLMSIVISLEITAKKMAKSRHILVKSLDEIITFGRLTCICSNKVGTMTQNNLKVQHIWYNNQTFNAHNKQLYGPEFKYQYDVNDPSFQRLHQAAIVHTDARFDVPQQKKLSGFTYFSSSAIGSTIDVCLIKFFQPIHNIQTTKRDYKQIQIKKNRNSSFLDKIQKCKLLIIRNETLGQIITFLKGPPQTILQLCSKIIMKGDVKKIHEKDIELIKQSINTLHQNREKIQCYAMLPLTEDIFNIDHQLSQQRLLQYCLQEKFIFLGMISVIDPYLPSIPNAIQRCRIGGIKLIIYSSDHTSQLQTFSKKIGAITMKTNKDYQKQGFSQSEALERANSIVIDNQLIEDTFSSNKQLGKLTIDSYCKKKQAIFARIRSMNKPLVVQSLRRLGHIVGAIGDGCCCVTYRQANLGICMGITGSDVEKEAANAILLQEDFSLIVDGVQQGRKSIQNIQKIIVYMLTSNMAQLCPFFAFVLFQIPLPLSCNFALYLSIGADLYGAISFAFQQPQIDIMTRFQSNKIVPFSKVAHGYGISGMLATFGGFFSYNLIMECYGIPFEIYYQLLSKQAYIPAAGVSFNNYLGDPENTFKLNTPFLGYNNNEGGSNFYSGNCNLDQFQSHFNFPNWITNTNSNVDLRAVYVKCCTNIGQNYFCPQFNWPSYSSVVHTISPVTGHEVAYTTEALFYAQSGYFTTVAIIQWLNLFARKSQRVSLIYSELNLHIFGGITLSTCLIALILFVPTANEALGGRPVPFLMLVPPGLGFTAILLLIQEIYKYLMI